MTCLAASLAAFFGLAAFLEALALRVHIGQQSISSDVIEWLSTTICCGVRAGGLG